MLHLQGPLLVVAPHPDDATLACAGLIQQAVGNVWVLHITAGDGFWRDAATLDETLTPTPQQYLALGTERIAEAREADAVLGVPRARQYMLGFPDGSMMRVVTSGTAPIRSGTTGRATVPYPLPMVYRTSVAYTAANLRALLREIVAAVEPQTVAYPVPWDQNSDHRAVAMAVQSALPTDYAGAQLQYLVHHGLYPGIGLDWDRELSPPADAPTAGVEVRLTRLQEHVKELAIAAHPSQTAVLGPWMQAFVGRNEPLWEVVSGDTASLVP